MKDYVALCGDSIRVVHPLFQTEGDGSIPISPLQLSIYEISVELAQQLNQLWHSRLPKITNPYSSHTVCFGAEFSNKWYATSIWTAPIARNFNGKGYIELRRMAIAEDAPKNTASRMLRIMKTLISQKFTDVVKLISYQDTEVHKGTIYAASGWKRAAIWKGHSWDRPNINRRRTANQATGDKIRWEYNI